MHNNLFLNQLFIYTEDGKIAYNEKFHKGINIIRGKNSSGKSTITHFIFYVLGGDFTDFVPEAQRCQTVYAEVEMNQTVFTIKRDLNKDEKTGKIKNQSPMFIYWGNLEKCLNSPLSESWKKFPYKMTKNLNSFSNIIFNLLDIPIVKGESNITLHQILRLLYIDQHSPTSSLFYYEQFDNQLTRETISDLLLGIYDESLYENKKNFNLYKKKLEKIKEKIKITQKFFSEFKNLELSNIEKNIEKKEKEISDIQNKILLFNKDKREKKQTSKSKLLFQDLEKTAVKQREKVSALYEKIEILRNEIDDSNFFISTLKKKIEALKNSKNTRIFFDSLPLQYCPECLTKITNQIDSSKCKLCKEEISYDLKETQIKIREQEIIFQINESNELILEQEEELKKLTAEHKSEKIELNRIQKRVNHALNNITSIDEEELNNLYTKKGYIEGEISQLRVMLKHANLYKNLVNEKNSLEESINFLETSIKIAKNKQENLKETINDKIKKEGLYLLSNDFERQDEFRNTNEFFIDYSNNLVFLDNKYSKYSASSNFYLKVAARFAIFLASLSIKRMRYPRFIFADNMEDKGIEKERAQNLQGILIDRLKQFNSNEFQMIYTTSYITEELNNSPYVVGEFYTEENRSLKNIPKTNKV